MVHIVVHQFVPKTSNEKNLSLKKIDPKTQLRFGGNWLHIIFRQIVLEAAQIWRELAPHYFPADCFGGAQLYGIVH